MKKFMLITILFTAFLGDCFSMDLKRKDRGGDSDYGSGDSPQARPARRAKIETHLNCAELFALADAELLAPDIFEQIDTTLNTHVYELGMHIDTIVDEHGRTLLSRVKTPDYAHILVTLGAQVNMPFHSPLFYAVTEAREHVAHFLITQCNASIDNLADHSPIHPSILVLSGGCSVDFRTFLVQWRQHLQAQ